MATFDPNFLAQPAIPPGISQYYFPQQGLAAQMPGVALAPQMPPVGIGTHMPPVGNGFANVRMPSMPSRFNFIPQAEWDRRRAMEAEKERNLDQAESFRTPNAEVPGWLGRQLGMDPTYATAVKEGTDKAMKSSLDETLKSITHALSNPAKPFSMALPGGERPMPMPGRVAPPNFGPARAALEGTRPGPARLSTEQERLSGIFGAGASAAAKGTRPGQILALAGGAMASEHAAYKASDRKVQDQQDERQREFGRQMAQFEILDAQSKHQNEWQNQSLQYQAMLKQWESMKPQIHMTENGVVAVVPGADGKRTLEFVPWPEASGMGAMGTAARKTAGGIGGQAYLAEFRDTVRAARSTSPLSQNLAVATATAKMMRRANLLVIPNGKDDEAANAYNKRAFGPIYNQEMIPKMMQQATGIVSQQGLNPGSKEFHEQWSHQFDSLMGAMLLQNPQLFQQWLNMALGKNSN